MGIFSNARKLFTKNKATPQKSEAKCPVDHGKIELVKATANDNPACVCGQGKGCYCKAADAKKKQQAEYHKAVVEKQKAASKTKPSKDAENKKAPAKAPAKKTPVKPATKAPAKKKPAPKKKK